MRSPGRSLRLVGMKVAVFPDAPAASVAAADLLIETLEKARAERGQAVVGLATGSTPVMVYEELVKRYRAGLLSFRKATTYNLDEFYPISPLDPRSYRAYMHRHLFSQVDIAPHRATCSTGRCPRGSWPPTPPSTTAGSSPMAVWISSSWGSAAMVTSDSTNRAT